MIEKLLKLVEIARELRDVKVISMRVSQSGNMVIIAIRTENEDQAKRLRDKALDVYKMIFGD